MDAPSGVPNGFKINVRIFSVMVVIKLYVDIQPIQAIQFPQSLANQLEFLQKYYSVQILTEASPGEKLSANKLKKKIFEFKEKLNLNETFFYLYYNQNVWVLLDGTLNYLGINFDEDPLNYERKSQGKAELLFKALGGKTKSVLDLSCGLAMDAVFLAKQGYKVEAVERNPMVYFLLEQALKASSDPRIKLLKIHFSEASHFIKTNISRLKDFDAIYFDPMYPEKRKSAKSRQELELFKVLVGKDDDAMEVFKLVKELGTRLIVKRPIHGDFLATDVKAQFVGKTVRYDVY